MTNFKIVPAEPTEEMLRVACDEEQRPLPMWTRMKAIYTATLSEAPVINIVATKNEQGQIVSVTLQDEDHRILEVIAEADVQGEPVGRVKTVGGYPDESEHTVEWLCKYRDLKDGDLLYTAPQPDEQQLAPDVPSLAKALRQYQHNDGGGLVFGYDKLLVDQHVAGLVEALESLVKGYVNLLEAGRDRIISLGGDCDPVPVMEQNDPWLRGARAVLVGHRKGGRK